MQRGMIFGKFYPPHLGHHYLIDSASEQCDTLTVLVMAAPHETIDGGVRSAWLRTIHPRVEVRHTPYDLAQAWPEDDEEAWRKFVAFIERHHPEAVDVLFTSEWYGESAARRLGCRHVAVDPMRSKVRVSGTQIRENPWNYAHFLHPLVRRYFLKHVCLIGPESSGKTTLARQLAEHFHTVWVPEYGREFSDAAGHTAIAPHGWKMHDFLEIARVQHERIDGAAQKAFRFLFSDTDALATQVWCERYLRVVPAFRYPRADLYLLTEPDLPFFQDGTRDGEHLRTWMFERLHEVIAAESLPFAIVSGTGPERLRSAIAACECFAGLRTSGCAESGEIFVSGRLL